MLLFGLALIFLPLQSCLAQNGMEILNPTSTSQFQCLMNSGACLGIMPFWVRVGKSDGSVDMAGIQNMKNLDTAANSNNDWYLSSPFFIPNINLNAIQQVNNVHQALVNNNVSLIYLWADLTDGVWSNDKQKNQQFVLELQKAMSDLLFVDRHKDNTTKMNFTAEMDFVIGYYAKASFWSKTFGSDFTLPSYNISGSECENSKCDNNTVSYHPSLMWNEVTGFENETGFAPFGGWNSPDFHLWNMNSNTCGVNHARIWLDDVDGLFGGCNICTDKCCCGLCCDADERKMSKFQLFKKNYIKKISLKKYRKQPNIV